MKLRALALALASIALPNSAHAADDFCSRMIVQAVNQFCQLLPNGLNLCQPVALVGPGPECTTPERQVLTPVPLGPPVMQPLAPWAAPFASSAWPASPAAGSPLAAPTTVAPSTQVTLAAPATPDLPRIMAERPKPIVATTPAPVIAPSGASANATAAAAGTTVALLPPATAPAATAATASKDTPDRGATVAATPAKAATTVAAPLPSLTAVTIPAATPAAAAAPLLPPIAVTATLTATPGSSTQAPLAAQQPALTAENAASVDALAHFDFDSANLTPVGRAVLDAWLAEAPKGKPVRVSGHADRLGPEPYNLKLSLRRAESVKQYLTGKGINPRRIQLEAKGESDPVKRCRGGATPGTKACLAPNRRVKIDPE